MVATVICQFCLYYADVYNLRQLGSRTEVFFRLLQALGAATLLLGVLNFAFPNFGLGERVVEASVISTIGIILLWRFAVDGVTRTYGAKEKILLIGSSMAARNLARAIRRRRTCPCG